MVPKVLLKVGLLAVAVWLIWMTLNTAASDLLADREGELTVSKIKNWVHHWVDILSPCMQSRMFWIHMCNQVYMGPIWHKSTRVVEISKPWYILFLFLFSAPRWDKNGYCLEAPLLPQVTKARGSSKLGSICASKVIWDPHVQSRIFEAPMGNQGYLWWTSAI